MAVCVVAEVVAVVVVVVVAMVVVVVAVAIVALIVAAVVADAVVDLARQTAALHEFWHRCDAPMPVFVVRMEYNYNRQQQQQHTLARLRRGEVPPLFSFDVTIMRSEPTASVLRCNVVSSTT
jgi:hypothetical protein